MKLIRLPSPGGVIYVRRTFALTSPSRVMPTPILLALPSNPIDTTIAVEFKHQTISMTVKAHDYHQVAKPHILSTILSTIARSDVVNRPKLT